MTIIVSVHALSTAPASAFFDRWADMSTWPEWNADTEWVRLDGPFVQGATGQLKPKGGPTVPFVVERLVPGREFIDVSRLFGARLTFDHQVTTHIDKVDIEITVSMTGPLSRLWRLLLGRGLKASAQRDLDALVRVAEAA